MGKIEHTVTPWIDRTIIFAGIVILTVALAKVLYFIVQLEIPTVLAVVVGLSLWHSLLAGFMSL